MSLAVFEDVARAHFSNPPATWHVVPTDKGSWNVLDNHGAIVDSCPTKAHAERCRHSGPAAVRWHRRTDWYLGYDPHSRTLTGTQQLIIGDIIEHVAAAAAVFDRATVIRPVQFRDRSTDDDRIWAAALLSNGRFQVRGDNLHTYDTGDLEFLDEQTTDDLTAFLDDLLYVEALRRSA
jgi:hypothetical protein